MTRPVVFLDFDGVMNLALATGYQPPHPGLRRENVAEVERFVERFNADVVISTSWREKYTVWQLRDFVRAAGGLDLAARFVAFTPIFERVPKRRYLRAAEVEAWRAAERSTAPHVIIDDSKKHNFPEAHFVHVKGARGFEPWNADVGARLFAAQGILA